MPEQMNTPEVAAKRRAALESREDVTLLLRKARVTWPARQKAKIAKKLEMMPATCRAGYLRAMERNSTAAAIKAHCLECVAWVRPEVTKCTGIDCPMYPYRPFQEEPPDAP